ncbi:MAG: hypothetical protein KC684_00145 [Candidatus Omnitrophica bacterium]|nr:hypothetical protein [Candidatus Omnitrophota bacterium]
MLDITDPKDSQVLNVQHLRKRSYRQQTGCVIVEGYPEVKKASQCRVPFETLYICPEIFEDVYHEFKDYPVQTVSKDVFAAMAFGERLKGILAVCQPKIYTFEDIHFKTRPLVVLLENVEKPGNLGAVLRSCDGAGVDCLLACESQTDIYNQHVVRSSIGAIFSVPTIACSNTQALDFLKQHNIRVLAASSKTDTIYTLENLKEPTAFVIGNEHSGLSPFWLEHADSPVKIPMQGIGQCLNAAASASVLVYEALRQRS